MPRPNVGSVVEHTSLDHHASEENIPTHRQSTCMSSVHQSVPSGPTLLRSALQNVKKTTHAKAQHLQGRPGLEWSAVGDWREVFKTLVASARAGDAYAVNVISARLSDSNKQVREAAVEALGEAAVRKGDAHIVDEVLKQLASDRPDVRCAALSALGSVADRGNVRAVDAVHGKLWDDDEEVTIQALIAMPSVIEAGIASKSSSISMKLAVSLLEAPQRRIRLAAGDAIVMMWRSKDIETVKLIIAGPLLHRSFDVRVASYLALSGIVQRQDGKAVLDIVNTLIHAIARVTDDIDDFDLQLRSTLLDTVAMIANHGHACATRALASCIERLNPGMGHDAQAKYSETSKMLSKQEAELQKLSGVLQDRLANTKEKHRALSSSISRSAISCPQERHRLERQLANLHASTLRHVEDLEDVEDKQAHLQQSREDLIQLARADWQVTCVTVAALAKLAFPFQRRDSATLSAFFTDTGHEEHHVINDVLELIGHAKTGIRKAIQKVAAGLRASEYKCRQGNVQELERKASLGHAWALEKQAEHYKLYSERARYLSEKETPRPEIIDPLHHHDHDEDGTPNGSDEMVDFSIGGQTSTGRAIMKHFHASNSDLHVRNVGTTGGADSPQSEGAGQNPNRKGQSPCLQLANQAADGQQFVTTNKLLRRLSRTDSHKLLRKSLIQAMHRPTV